MLSRNYLPRVVKCEVTNTKGQLDVTAKRSEDQSTLQLQVVNLSDQPVTATIRIEGFVAVKPVAQVTELSGRLDDANSRRETWTAIVPQAEAPWKNEVKEGKARHTFPSALVHDHPLAKKRINSEHKSHQERAKEDGHNNAQRTQKKTADKREFNSINPSFASRDQADHRGCLPLRRLTDPGCFVFSAFFNNSATSAHN